MTGEEEAPAAPGWEALTRRGPGKHDRGTRDMLTADEAAKGPLYQAAWLKALKSTTCNHADAERGLVAAYAAAQLKKPEVRWYPSPLKAVVAGVFVATEGQRTVSDDIFYNCLRRASDVCQTRLSSRMRHCVQAALADWLEQQVGGVDVAVTSDIAVRALVIGDERPHVGSILAKLAERTVFRLAQLATYDYVRAVLQVRELADTAGIALACSTAGAYLPFERTVLASDPPTKLLLDERGRPHSADSYAVEYSDGFGVACWHGVRIPHEAVLKNLTDVEWADIESTADGQVRDALADIKAFKWSKKRPVTAPIGAPPDTVDERKRAAEAIKRLGGLGAVRALTEREED